MTYKDLMDEIPENVAKRMTVKALKELHTYLIHVFNIGLTEGTITAETRAKDAKRRKEKERLGKLGFIVKKLYK